MDRLFETKKEPLHPSIKTFPIVKLLTKAGKKRMV